MSDDFAPEPRDAAEMGTSLAVAEWADAARPVLLEAAGRYRGLVKYKEMAAALQSATGITTSRPVATWLGDVLALVARDCVMNGEPLLSSLCVSVQGSVGERYADTVEELRGSRPEDPDEHAAEERLRCYRHWEAAGLPADGGTPLRTAHFKPVKKAASRTAAAPRAARTPRAATTRATATKVAKVAKPEPKPAQLCPTCFTQVPASGICDYCD